jgi:hypothetical protein
MSVRIMTAYRRTRKPTHVNNALRNQPPWNCFLYRLQNLPIVVDTVSQNSSGKPLAQIPCNALDLWIAPLKSMDPLRAAGGKDGSATGVHAHDRGTPSYSSSGKTVSRYPVRQPAVPDPIPRQVEWAPPHISALRLLLLRCGLRVGAPLGDT